MPGLYTITTRADGTTLTAAIYNSDHQNHVDNHTPDKMDDLSATVADMKVTSDPGEVGSESQATSLKEEVQQLRHMIAEITGADEWYETPVGIINRNPIINGNGAIQQRADKTSWITGVYGYAGDRFAGAITGTSISGTLTTTSSANVGITGYAHKFSSVSVTSGTVHHRYRMESKDAVHYKNQTATFTVKVYHTHSAALTYTIYVNKADSADDFSAVTAIGNDGGTSVSASTATTLTFTLAMGDCSNGVEIEVRTSSATLSSVDLEFTDYKMEKGSVATDFVTAGASIAEELSLCQRYYEKSYDLVTDPGTVTTNGAITAEEVNAGNVFHNLRATYKTRKRIAATPTIYSPNSGTSGKVYDNNATADRTVASVSGSGDSGFSGVTTDSTFTQTSGAVVASIHYTVDAELQA